MTNKFEADMEVVWNWMSAEKAKVAHALQPVIDELEALAAKDLKMDLGTLIGIVVSTVAAGGPLGGVITIAETAIEAKVIAQGTELAATAAGGVEQVLQPDIVAGAEAVAQDVAATSNPDFSTLNK
jgi:hypothetical protein